MPQFAPQPWVILLFVAVGAFLAYMVKVWFTRYPSFTGLVSVSKSEVPALPW